MSKTVLERVRRVISDRLGIDLDKVDSDSYIQAELGADSIDFVAMVSGLEDEFGLVIPEEDYAMLTQVRDFVKYIERAI